MLFCAVPYGCAPRWYRRGSQLVPANFVVMELKYSCEPRPLLFCRAHGRTTRSKTMPAVSASIPLPWREADACGVRHCHFPIESSALVGVHLFPGHHVMTHAGTRTHTHAHRPFCAPPFSSLPPTLAFCSPSTAPQINTRITVPPLILSCSLFANQAPPPFVTLLYSQFLEGVSRGHDGILN